MTQPGCRQYLVLKKGACRGRPAKSVAGCATSPLPLLIARPSRPALVCGSLVSLRSALRTTPLQRTETPIRCRRSPGGEVSIAFNSKCWRCASRLCSQGSRSESSSLTQAGQSASASWLNFAVQHQSDPLWVPRLGGAYRLERIDLFTSHLRGRNRDDFRPQEF